MWDAISTRRHGLSVSGLFNHSTGTPYSAAADIDVGNYVQNPGYATPAALQTYFFSKRGAYRTDNVTSFDLALYYSFTLAALGTEISLFLQPEVRNLFNNHGAIRHDNAMTVTAAFNPWTEEPIEGEHYVLGDNFGRPVSEADYQRPRTFLISLGLRF